MSDLQSECALLQLPEDLLRQVFDVLRPVALPSRIFSGTQDDNADAHALHSTCRLAREITARFITSANLNLAQLQALTGRGFSDTRNVAADWLHTCVVKTLRCFPSHSVLINLCLYGGTQHGSTLYPEQYDLKALFLGPQVQEIEAQLHSVAHLLIDRVALHPDALAFVPKCFVSLQSIVLRMVTPAARQGLPSLSHLAALPHLRRMELDEVVIEDFELPALGQLTQLKTLVWRVGHTRTWKLNVLDLLSRVLLLTQLEHLELSLCLDAYTGGALNDQEVSKATVHAAASLPQLLVLVTTLIFGTPDAVLIRMPHLENLEALAIDAGSTVSKGAGAEGRSSMPENEVVTCRRMQQLLLHCTPSCPALTLAPLAAFERLVVPAAPVVALLDTNDGGQLLRACVRVLARCCCSAPGMKLEAMRPLTALTVLVPADMRAPSAPALVDEFRPLGGILLQLVLKESPVYASMLRALANALPRMHCLDLLHCWVPSGEADAFCAAILDFPCLQALHLGVSGVSVDALVSTLAESPTLQHVSLGRETFTMAEFRQAQGKVKDEELAFTLSRRSSGSRDAWEACRV